MRSLAIFDFDGTLVDSITDVALCFNRALAKHGYPVHPIEAFNSFVGGNLETVVSRMLPRERCTPRDIDVVKTCYRAIYQSDIKPNTKPYPGIMELLISLNAVGITLAVNTNKGQELVDSLVKQMFNTIQLSAVIGYHENYPSKPDAYGVKKICELCGKNILDAIYIGDGRSDIETARNAGIPCILVSWGQANASDLLDTYIEGVAQTPQDIMNIIKRL